MISTALRTGIIALALTASAAGVTQASAHPFFPPFGHGPILPIHSGPFGPGHFPGWHHGGGWGGGFGWGGYYPQYPVYGGCTIRRILDDEGDVVIRKVCS